MLIDTSGFFSLHDQAEKHHAEAQKLYRERRLRLTTSYILAEYVALALVRGLFHEKVLTFSAEVLTDATIEITWVDEALHTKAVELLQARQDKTYSLCDAVSFIVMSERGITDALTTDKHFEQEGFVRLLK